jgi:hypothetical protein
MTRPINISGANCIPCFGYTLKTGLRALAECLVFHPQFGRGIMRAHKGIHKSMNKAESEIGDVLVGVLPCYVALRD